MAVDWKKLKEFMKRAEKSDAANWHDLLKEAQEFEPGTQGMAVEHLYLFEPTTDDAK